MRWHAAGRADTEDNGLALCALHHTAFDRGAIGLDDDRGILVSQHVCSGAGSIELLVRFSGQPLIGPLRRCQPLCPSTSVLCTSRTRRAELLTSCFSRLAGGSAAWHRREVFREPARARD